MVFNATFNNISVISWWSLVLVEKTAEYSEKPTDMSQFTGKLDLIMLYGVHLLYLIMLYEVYLLYLIMLYGVHLLYLIMLYGVHLLYLIMLYGVYLLYLICCMEYTSFIS